MCDHCGRGFHMKHKLKEHVDAVHLKLKNHKCELCDWTTGFTTNMSLHLKKVHGVFNSVGRKRPATKRAEDAKRREDSKKLKRGDGATKEDNRPESTPRSEKDSANDKTESEAQSSTTSKGADTRDTAGEDLEYSCDICERKYSSKYRLQAHVTSVHLKIFRYKCDECDYATAYSSSLKSHKKGSHGAPGGTESKKVCELCSFTTASHESLRKHMKDVHGMESLEVQPQTKAIYEREWENFKSYLAFRNMRDVEVSHDENSCPGEDEFISYFDHLYHEKRLKMNTIWVRFTSLNHHFIMERGKKLQEAYPRLMHNFNSYAPDPGGKRATHTCDTCEKTFSDKFSLRSHISSVHLGLKPHKCKECDYASSTRSDLNKHRKSVHSGIMPVPKRPKAKKPKKEWACKLCPYTATTNRDLREHVRAAHPKESNRKLESDTKAAYERTWSEFTRYCKREKKLACGQCDFATELKEVFADHLQKPHDKHCDKCEYATPSQNMLEWHMTGGTRVDVARNKKCPFKPKRRSLMRPGDKPDGDSPGEDEFIDYFEHLFHEKRLQMNSIWSLFSRLNQVFQAENGKRFQEAFPRLMSVMNEVKDDVDNHLTCGLCPFSTPFPDALKSHIHVRHEKDEKKKQEISSQTKVQYGRAWSAFEKFCDGIGKFGFPGEDEFVSYLDHLLHERKFKRSSIAADFSKLKQVHLSDHGVRFDDSYPRLTQKLRDLLQGFWSRQAAKKSGAVEGLKEVNFSPSKKQEFLKEDHEGKEVENIKQQCIKNENADKEESFNDNGYKITHTDEQSEKSEEINNAIVRQDFIVPEQDSNGTLDGAQESITGLDSTEDDHDEVDPVSMYLLKIKKGDAADRVGSIEGLEEFDFSPSKNPNLPKKAEEMQDSEDSDKSSFSDDCQDVDGDYECGSEITIADESKTEIEDGEGNQFLEHNNNQSADNDPVSMYLYEMEKYRCNVAEKGRPVKSKACAVEGLKEVDFSPSKKQKVSKEDEEGKDEESIKQQCSKNKNADKNGSLDYNGYELTHTDEQLEIIADVAEGIQSMKPIRATSTLHTAADDNPNVEIGQDDKENHDSMDPVSLYLLEMEKYRQNVKREKPAKAKIIDGIERIDEADFSPSKKRKVFKEDNEGTNIRQECTDPDMTLTTAKNESQEEDARANEITSIEESPTPTKVSEDVPGVNPSKEVVDNLSVDVGDSEQVDVEMSDPVSVYLREMEKYRHESEEEKGKLKTLSCARCDYATKSKGLFAEHERQPHDKLCDKCDYATPSQEMLDGHVNGDDVEKTKKCPFKPSKKLEKESSQSLEEEPSPEVPDPASKTKHVYKGSWVKFEKFCGEGFDGKEPGEKQLMAFFDDLFEKGKKMSTVWSTFSRLNCIYQERFGERMQGAFPNVMLRLRGLARKERKLTCGRCHFATESPEDFAEHKKLPHDKHCAQCKYAAPSDEMLDWHVKEGHKRRSWICDKCPFASTTRKRLLHHTRRPHRQCESCDFVAVGDHRLRAHVRTEHPERYKEDREKQGGNSIAFLRSLSFLSKCC